MPKVADYVVLADGKSSLQAAGSAAFFNFTLPSTGIWTGHAIVSFQLEVEAVNGGGISNLNWEFIVNGTLVTDFTHNTDRFGAIQEVFDARLLHTGGNIATVHLSSGSGGIEISDIVIWFQNAV
jgi:hypothetical protein